MPTKVPLHEELGISYRMLDHYIRRGYLHGTQPGSGRDREFSPKELEVAHLMVRLIHIGFTPAAASAYARAGIERRWVGSLAITMGTLTTTGMLEERGYPRYPFNNGDAPEDAE